MPEEVKISSYTAAKDYKSDYCLSADDSHPESSIYADHSDREMSRSETSSCSDESSCYKQNGHETVEIIPTRTIKTSVPKPAANPLQFVKIGPCDLYRSAQKQIQKVSEVKKPKKEVKDETAEDWQSNLDSWKCNRRKQQEHIIERVVEVKKLELEEHDRNRKRTKTFSEMMEERTSKGRKSNLPVYLEEDDDLSELGLSSNKNRNESSSTFEDNEEENHEEMEESCANRKCNGLDDMDQAQNQHREATYESAIQSYETRMKSLTSSSSEGKKSTTVDTTNTNTTDLRKYGRRASATKIEEKLSELERIKNRSVSTTDLTESNKKNINIPKVNIFKRKEIFEKISNTNETNKSKRLNNEIPPVRSIKERLSSLGKTVEETTTTTMTTIMTAKAKNVLVPEVSVKDRLSSINKKINEQTVCTVPEKSVSRERFSQSKISNADEIEKKEKSKEYVTFETSLSPNKPEELLPTSNGEYNSSGRSSSSEDYENVHQMNHFHHRSLDSLQGHDSPNGFCFERVQSLECIDCCNYPASVLSGDTDREDSGIHTADVSSSVSQADDFDLHADTSMDVDLKSQNTTALINDNMKVDKSSHSDFCFVSQEAESSLDDVREHVDVTIIKHENQSDNFNLKENTTNATKEEGPSAEEQSVEVNQKRDAAIELNEICDTNQNISEQLKEDDILQNKDELCSQVTPQNHDISCDDNVESSVDEDCWTANFESVDQENTNNYVEESLVEEKISPVLNREHLEKLSKINQNFTKIEEECISKTEPSATSQNFDYMYMMNNKFGEENQNEFSTSNSVFAFEPSLSVAEPPKEKPPPPPPIDNSDEELDRIENSNNLRRMGSTKRIKKEIRQKRSSFLGIEGYDDDSYLEPELEAVKPPPDMTTFLQEERRLEKLLYRQSICSESDSTQGESRDSGVELDKNHNEENLWLPENSHSRQDSEIYANTSTTSEEDEIIKKEREILEILELEEQRNYETETKNECNYLGEKLVLKLKELECQKNAAYWDQENEQSCLDNQHKSLVPPNHQNHEEQIMDQKHYQLHEAVRQSADSVLLQQQWANRSLQDIRKKEIPISSVDDNQLKPRLDYRNSMPNIQQEAHITSSNHHKQPPPVPANKPTHFKEQPMINRVSNPQQMSKQTLQALSAVPRCKIVATDSWVQTKKKPRQEVYNYQHWLIQEAEHRRITEYQQRQKENTVHNYINVHPDFSESAPLTDASGLENRTSHQHPNRVVTYSHPQMLPYRNQNQTYSNTNEYRSQNKVQYSSNNNTCNNNNSKPLPDSVIQTLTQRVQNRFAINDAAKQRRQRESYSNVSKQQEKMLSVSGKKKCSHCDKELGRGAAMIIESLRLFYHIDCFRCCVCCVQLGDGLMGTDVRVRNSKLHCHSCYSNDEGLKFSCV